MCKCMQTDTMVWFCFGSRGLQVRILLPRLRPPKLRRSESGLHFFYTVQCSYLGFEIQSSAGSVGQARPVFDNYDIINRLTEFKILDLPILLGVSRKSFLGKFLSTNPKLRLEGSLAANILAVQNGANILRVHNIAETKKAVHIADLFQERKWGSEPNILEDIFNSRS